MIIKKLLLFPNIIIKQSRNKSAYMELKSKLVILKNTNNGPITIGTITLIIISDSFILFYNKNKND